MSAYVLKTADRPLTQVIDWSRGDLSSGETVLRDLGWGIQPVGPDRAELRIARQELSGCRSLATFEGGIPGRAYMVFNRVKTSDDRVLSRAVVLRIAQGTRPY